MKVKVPARIIFLIAMLLSIVPVRAQALAVAAAPPVDMFQLPWEQGLAWVAYDGLDNGSRRSKTSPHYYGLGGALDFAPRVNMKVGEDTSNDWVTAAAAGTVYQISYCYVKIDHGNGWLTEYWHLGNIQVSLGEKVSRNQRLGVIHNNANQQVCLGNEFPGPHLHFVFRPKVVDTPFAGWAVNYNALTNKTTFSKGGQTVGLLQPLLNVPNLQIVSRGFIEWDTQYTGTVDPYRYERWSLILTEQTTFNISVTPNNSGFVPIIVLLNGDGIEIARGNGSLDTTQPIGFYSVQIQTDAGTGYYNLIATRQGGGGGTSTPIVTETPTTGTPSVTETPLVTNTPTPTDVSPQTETPFITETPVITNTPIVTETSGTPVDTFTPTPTITNTPDMTDTPSTPGTPTSTQITITETPTGTLETPVTPGTPVQTPTTIPTPTGPYVLVDVLQSSLILGETSLVNVSLNNVPVEGYTSTEFVCSYDPEVILASSMLAADLFGSDPVSALSGPANGQFILAIAGSTGQRATSSGVAFSFLIQGLQAGQSPVQCTARVSQGLGTLDPIAYIPDSVMVLDTAPTSTSTVPTSAIVTGQVLASKTVTIQLYDAQNTLVVSQIANADGTFSIPISGGTYTIIASAEGFLNAQGSVNLIDGVVTTMSTVSLPAGDIDGNGVIDQFDALSIGINYNASTPAAADLDNNGVINVLDLELLAANYRRSGALAWQ